MQNEILSPVLPTDETAIPRYDILNPDGTKLAVNAQLVLKNQIQQEGTPYSKETVLPAELCTTFGLPATATLAQALEYLASAYAAKTHAATHHTGGTDALTPVDIGAATAPTSVTVTLPVSGWTLNSSTTCYEQTVPVTGMLTTDNTATVTAWPHGSTDAAAQLLTDAAYAAIFTQGGYAAVNEDGKLYIRGPAGGDKPQVNFTVDVVVHR